MSESLRDELVKAFDEHIPEETPAQPAPQVETPAAPQEFADNKPAAAPVEEKPGRTAGRPRDEHGRLLPGKADPAAKAPIAEPKKIARPSSWKKDHWEAFDQLATANPALAEYINQREGEYAKGVSTYKSEWEKAKPLLDAVAPYAQDFQRWGIDPARQFQTYVEIHKGLALGSPEQKLGMLLRIAQDYQIPVQQLFVQGQDGRLYFNQQIQPTAPQQRQQPDIRTSVRDVLAEERAASEVQEMAADTEKYPHLATVKEVMVGLLQAGQARDLKDAYAKAIRLDDGLWQAEQDNTRKVQEEAKAQAERKRVAAAKANAVSVRSATPAAPAAEGKKGLRATLEQAFDEHTASRV